jgi:hypothetical protein
VSPASPLPWRVCPEWPRHVMFGDNEVAECWDAERHESENMQDARYIVHAANALPALIAQRDALLAALKGFMESPVWRSVCDYEACGCETAQLYAAGEAAIQTVEATSHEG